MDVGEQPELADLAERNRERVSDRVFCPVFRSEAFDRPPEVDGGHRGACHVFDDAAHWVMIVWIFDQDVDFGEAELDGEAHTARAVDDGEIAVFFGRRSAAG